MSNTKLATSAVAKCCSFSDLRMMYCDKRSGSTDTKGNDARYGDLRKMRFASRQLPSINTNNGFLPANSVGIGLNTRVLSSSVSAGKISTG
ncbi:Uncharacterised protein [Vibrio cholerae]|nr:Uncharacterised protein [Vibrio cholerae]